MEARQRWKVCGRMEGSERRGPYLGNDRWKEIGIKMKNILWYLAGIGTVIALQWWRANPEKVREWGEKMKMKMKELYKKWKEG